MDTLLAEKNKILQGLNAEQEEAVTFGKGPLLIIAGAGTGKTTVLTRRIGHLLEQNLAKTGEILALTFTEKAANEMLERLDILLPLGYSEIEISTFHSFAQKLLSDYAYDIGLPGDFKVITELKAYLMLKEKMDDLKLDYYKPLGNPSKFLHALIKHFGKAKGERITPEKYLSYAEELKLRLDQPEIKKKKRTAKSAESDSHDQSGINQQEALKVMEVAEAYHFYQKMLLDEGCLDFGDLINYAIKLLKTRPIILESLQNKYKYVLVDEFQDTDLAQYEMVKLLSLPQNNITVVGDDDQSIYKFRGASISNILKFKEDYPDTRQIALIENYRSSQAILDKSYAFILKNNPERLECRLDISKKMIGNQSLPGKIEVLFGQTVHEEARLVAEKIIEISQNENLSLNEFAILTRANDHAEPFISELAKAGIPYMYLANRGLYKKPFILDLLAYLNLLDNYHESANMFRVLNFEKFRVPEEDLVSIFSTAQKKALSIYEILKHLPAPVLVSDAAKEKSRLLLDLIQKHSSLARTQNATQVILEALNDLGIISELAHDDPKNQEKRSLLEQFYRKCQNFEGESDDKSLKGFLNLLKLELSAGETGDLQIDPDMGPEAVKIMTVHSAKGLEFSCVFVANLVDQRFPSRERREQIEVPQALVDEIFTSGDVHLMEERRLFYVAMTRAKRFLFLTWASDYGGTRLKKPSRFLEELNLVTKEKVKPSGKVFFKQDQKLPLKLTSKTLPVPEAFDFSQISTFLKCPLEYKYKYVFKLPLPGAAPFSFGQTMHSALKKFLQTMKQANCGQSDLFGGRKDKLEVPPKDLLMKYYEESWVDDWYPDKINKERYRKEGILILKKFYEHFKANPKLPKFLEHPFRLKLAKYQFKGRIDRIDQNPDKTVSIIDYKTGEIRTKLEKVDKEQLLIYQWAAQEYLEENVKELSYCYLKNPSAPLAFLGASKEIEELKGKLINTIEEIVECIKTDGFHEKDMRKSHDCAFRDLLTP
jgi:DNA helicase II / ATP-dependent DNA helicase PcrA